MLLIRLKLILSRLNCFCDSISNPRIAFQSLILQWSAEREVVGQRLLSVAMGKELGKGVRAATRIRIRRDV